MIFSRFDMIADVSAFFFRAELICSAQYKKKTHTHFIGFLQIQLNGLIHSDDKSTFQVLVNSRILQIMCPSALFTISSFTAFHTPHEKDIARQLCSQASIPFSKSVSEWHCHICAGPPRQPVSQFSGTS